MDEYGKRVEHSLPREHIQLPEEYSGESAREVFRKEEFHAWPTEYEQESKKTKNTHKSKDRKNMLRKMGYMLASAVTIISLAQTIEPSKGILVDVSAYSGISSANGGVIPMKHGGDVGMISYEGEPIGGDMTSYDLICAPNQKGYSLWRDREKQEIVVFNANGQLVSGLGVDGGTFNDFTINDDDVISYRIREEGNTVVFFCDLKGNVIAKYASAFPEENGEISYIAMRDGKAFVNEYKGSFRRWQQVSVIMEDGSSQIIQTHERGDEEDYLSYPLGGYSEDDGYYVGERPVTTFWGNLDAGVSWRLVDGESGEQSARVKRVGRDAFIKHASEEYVKQLDEEYANGWDSLKANNLKSYLDENVPMYHYKTYGCMSIFKEKDSLHKDVLFDYLNENIHDTIVEDAIAVYDEIIFDNYDYLAVRDGEKYFYIDLQGKKVSKTYAKATAFNSQGYALVMGNSGIAELIDSNFKTLDTIKGVTDIQINGEVFLVTIEDKLYSYYYGK